jgi:uncharacterized membrane protein
MLPRVTTTAAAASQQRHAHAKKNNTMSNFAPFQDDPETQRALSPPPLHSPRASLDRTRPRAILSPPTRTYEQHDYFGADADDAPYLDSPTAANTPLTSSQPSNSHASSRREDDFTLFSTSLGLRLDYEAVLAYILPPFSGVFLLIMEHQSDYVRFHAWQSALVWSFLGVIHVIFSWSTVISWVLFLGDVIGIGWLGWRAYRDGKLLFEDVRVRELIEL